MKLSIDQKADALYLSLLDGPAADTEEVAPGILLDYSADGKVVGIEMLYLSKRAPGLDPSRLIFDAGLAKR